MAEQWSGEHKAGDKEQWTSPTQSPQRTPSKLGVLNSWVGSSLTTADRAEAVTGHAVVPTYFVVTSALAAFVLGVVATAFCLLLRGPRKASRLRNGSAKSKNRAVGDGYERRAKARDAEGGGEFDNCHKSTADQGTVTLFRHADDDALNEGAAVACCDEHGHRRSLGPLPTAKGCSSRIRANQRRQRFRSFSAGSTMASCALYSAAAYDSTSDEQDLEDEDLAETEIMQDDR